MFRASRMWGIFCYNCLKREAEHEKDFFKKNIVIVLIIVTLIATMYNVIYSIKNKTVPNFLGLTGLAPIFVALYNESDYIYQTVNKIKAYVKNNTVVFKPTIRMDLKDEINIHMIEEDIMNLVSKYDLKYKYKDIYKSEHGIQIKLTTSNKLNFQISASIFDNGAKQQLIVTFTYQLSSRTVKSTWNQFKIYKDFLITQHISNNYLYTITIDLNSSNLNPFYKITVKTIKPFTIKNVQISIKNDDLNFSIQKNKIYATSDQIDVLENVVNNYIPLTNVY